MSLCSIIYCYIEYLSLESDRLVLAKAAQLSGVIEAEVKKINEERAKVRRQQIVEEEKFWEYYKVQRHTTDRRSSNSLFYLIE